MKFDISKFKKNIRFFIWATVAIVLLLIFSLIFDNKGKTLKEIELAKGEVHTSKLIINEIMSSNKGTIADENGKLYDYVELYNGSNKDINLLNYGLSDASGVKWVFPDAIIKSKNYLVVFLSGTKEGGLHANFKLKASGGERLALYKPSGKITDGIDTVALDKNTCMARDEEGKWVIQTKPTPGFANTKEGHEKFLESLMSNDAKTVVINEILPSNKGQFKDSFGNYSGFIEVKNISDKTINLKGYSLSNSLDINFKWAFPNINLESGKVVAVFTSGKNETQGELHTSFKLDKINGAVRLSNNKGKIIDKVDYTSLGNGYAYINTGKKFEVSTIISFGERNTIEGVKKFQEKYVKAPKDLIINEVMNSNFSYLAQNGGQYYDWIELYNNSNDTIKLSDYYITTNIDNVEMFRLPDAELKKGEYYILICSGEQNLSNNSYKHTNFKISSSQSLYLLKDKKVVDAMFVAGVPIGYSMGRGSESGIYYYKIPTPKSRNGDGIQCIAYTPSASKKTGIYNDINNLEVAISGTGTIYYSLDGSKPNTNSKIYSSPLSIKKTTVLKTIAYESGKKESPVSTYSYIINENHTLPIMSLSINNEDLNSLHYNPWIENYEKKVTAQFIEQDGTGFDIDAGLKLFGGSARGLPKKSYELKFRKKYGNGKLHYQVFKNKDYSVFNSIVLRTGAQDEFGDASKKTLIRDIFTTALVDEYTSVDVQAYRPTIVYINGEYYGIYFIREKVDETFVGNHYNVNATKENTDILRVDSQVKSGSARKYNKMIGFINNNSLDNPANYAKIKEQIDIENIIDFWIAEDWTANNDIINFRYFSNPDIDNGKWKFIFYDLDFGVYNVTKNYYAFSIDPSGMTQNGYSTILLRNLIKSPEFKKQYAERLSYNLKNTWETDTVIKKIDSVIDEIGINEIKRNLKFWQKSYSDWERNIEFLKDYARQRKLYMINDAKQFLSLSDKEMEKYFGDII